MPRPLSRPIDERIDLPGAVSRDRRALARRGHSANPADRAGAHANLADALERTAIPAAVAEAYRHRLAALVYQLVASLSDPLTATLGAYATRFRRAAAVEAALDVGRLTDLLDDPAFSPLDEWLREHGSDVAETQTAVDFYLEQARRIGTGQGLAESDAA